MKNNQLPNRSFLRSALFILLLSAVGMKTSKAQNNAPAEAINGSCTVIASGYEATYSFAKPDDKTLVTDFVVTSADGDHDYVDLGLPSGTLWATCNVGAKAPEEYGDYFAWGETQSKSTYNCDTYKYCNCDTSKYDCYGEQLTKYCYDSTYGYNGFTDTLTLLQPMDDAATANWGNGWCMPTAAQWLELCKYTTNQWITQNGVPGWMFTSGNGNSLFLPAAGFRMNNVLYLVGSNVNYWSSSLDTRYDPVGALQFFFFGKAFAMTLNHRCIGISVRAVRSLRQN